MSLKRLYIIEDDANILYGLQAKLRVEGFEIETEDGSGSMEEIMNKIRIFNPGYIILDLILPKIDGNDLLNALKTDQHLNKPLVFVFTNLNDNDSRARSEKSGADYYFIKNDLAIDEFVLKVKNIIKNKEKNLT